MTKCKRLSFSLNPQFHTDSTLVWLPANLSTCRSCKLSTGRPFVFPRVIRSKKKTLNILKSLNPLYLTFPLSGVSWQFWWHWVIQWDQQQSLLVFLAPQSFSLLPCSFLTSRLLDCGKKKTKQNSYSSTHPYPKSQKHPKANSDCDHFIGWLHHRPFEIM